MLCFLLLFVYSCCSLRFGWWMESIVSVTVFGGCIPWPIKLFWMKIAWYDFIRNTLCGVISIVQTARRLGHICFHFILLVQHILEESEKKKYLLVLCQLLFYISRIHRYLWVCLCTVTWIVNHCILKETSTVLKLEKKGG